MIFYANEIYLSSLKETSLKRIIFKISLLRDTRVQSGRDKEKKLFSSRQLVKCKLSIRCLSFPWASSRNRMPCVKMIASYDSVTFKNHYVGFLSLRNIVERNCELNKTVSAKTPSRNSS